MTRSEPIELPFQDRQDFEDADRGFIGAMEPCIVTTEDGRVIWDNDAYAFLAGDCPDSANPSLWRQSQLCPKQGLYEVTDGIYQVRRPPRATPVCWHRCSASSPRPLPTFPIVIR